MLDIFQERYLGFDMPQRSTTKSKQNRKTNERRQNFSSNLGWEMANKNLSADALLAELKTLNPHRTYHETTVNEWLEGKVANPQKEDREALRQIFGYADQDSILREDHIGLRKQQFRTQSSAFDSSLVDMFSATDKATSSTGPQTKQVIDEILESPLAPYMTLLAYLLKSKLS